MTVNCTCITDKRNNFYVECKAEMNLLFFSNSFTIIFTTAEENWLYSKELKLQHFLAVCTEKAYSDFIIIAPCFAEEEGLIVSIFSCDEIPAL